MVRTNKNITVGARVEGCFGPLIPNPNPAIKRRVRSRVVGTVLRGLERHRWEVRFDFDGKQQEVRSNALKLVPASYGIPLNEASPSPSRTLASGRNSSSSDTTVTTTSVTAPATNVTASTIIGNDADADADPSIHDAFMEHEDDVAPDNDDEEDVNENADPPEIPNNDFCFTEDDFLRATQEYNDATRHHGIYNNRWDEIKQLEGHEEVCTNAKDGTVVWKVVPQVLDDELKDVREYEEKLFSDDKYNTYKKDVDDWDYNKSFWALWPSTIDEDISSLQEIITKENVKRKEKFQRPIKIITKR